MMCKCTARGEVTPLDTQSSQKDNADSRIGEGGMNIACIYYSNNCEQC